MQRKRTAGLILLFLTLIIALLFVFRDRIVYQYKPSYRELYSMCDEACREKWAAYVEDYPAIEFREAERITDSLLPKGSISSFEKITRIGGWLRQRFAAQNGDPEPFFSALSPLQQYRHLTRKKDAELWCGNWAVIFSYFCWTQGIVTRNIGIRKQGDNHMITECYIPETGRWVVSDLTFNLLLVRNSKGTYLDALSLRDSLQKGASLEALQWLGDTVIQQKFESNSLIRYYDEDYLLQYYRRIDNYKVYSLRNRLERFFLPRPWYDIYGDGGGSNTLFYLRGGLFILWAIALLFWLYTVKKSRS